MTASAVLRVLTVSAENSSYIRGYLVTDKNIPNWHRATHLRPVPQQHWGHALSVVWRGRRCWWWPPCLRYKCRPPPRHSPLPSHDRTGWWTNLAPSSRPWDWHFTPIPTYHTFRPPTRAWSSSRCFSAGSVLSLTSAGWRGNQSHLGQLWSVACRVEEDQILSPLASV